MMSKRAPELKNESLGSFRAVLQAAKTSYRILHCIEIIRTLAGVCVTGGFLRLGHISDVNVMRGRGELCGVVAF